MSRKYVRITQIDVIMAQEDPEYSAVVINRLMPFIYHIANIIYRYYGAAHDGALDIDDIISNLKIKTLKAIRSYNPEGYKDSKDTKNTRAYLDPFPYISRVISGFITDYNAYRSRVGRIPPEILTVLEPNFYATQHEDEYSMVDIFIDGIVTKYEGITYNNIPVKPVMEMLFSGMSHQQIADKLGCKANDIQSVISCITDETPGFQGHFDFLEDIYGK